MKKYFFTLVITLCCLSILGAQNLNSYKYVVVPDLFGFQKEEHQYDLNRLTQFLLNKYNFVAIIQGEELPADYKPCESLKADLVSGGGLFKTALELQLKDCSDKVIYTSNKGISRIKEYKKSYHEALRNAFNDPLLKSHKYLKPLTAATVMPLGAKEVGKKLNTAEQEVIARPTVDVSLSDSVHEEAKEELALQAKDLQLTMRGKTYVFKGTENGYDIYQNGIKLGNASAEENSLNYKIDAGALSGKGYFDDFGNFVLKRTNPASQKEITDTMVREK